MSASGTRIKRKIEADEYTSKKSRERDPSDSPPPQWLRSSETPISPWLLESESPQEGSLWFDTVETSVAPPYLLEPEPPMSPSWTPHIEKDPYELIGDEASWWPDVTEAILLGKNTMHGTEELSGGDIVNKQDQTLLLAEESLSHIPSIKKTNKKEKSFIYLSNKEKKTNLEQIIQQQRARYKQLSSTEQLTEIKKVTSQILDRLDEQSMIEKIVFSLIAMGFSDVECGRFFYEEKSNRLYFFHINKVVSIFNKILDVCENIRKKGLPINVYHVALVGTSILTQIQRLELLEENYETLCRFNLLASFVNVLLSNHGTIAQLSIILAKYIRHAQEQNLMRIILNEEEKCRGVSPEEKITELEKRVSSLYQDISLWSEDKITGEIAFCLFTMNLNISECKNFFALCMNESEVFTLHSMTTVVCVFKKILNIGLLLKNKGLLVEMCDIARIGTQPMSIERLDILEQNIHRLSDITRLKKVINVLQKGRLLDAMIQIVECLVLGTEILSDEAIARLLFNEMQVHMQIKTQMQMLTRMQIYTPSLVHPSNNPSPSSIISPVQLTQYFPQKTSFFPDVSLPSEPLVNPPATVAAVSKKI